MKNKNQLIINFLSLHLIIATSIIFYVFIYSNMIDIEMNIKYIIFSAVVIGDLITSILIRKLLNKKTVN